MTSCSYLTPNHSRSQSEIQGDLHSSFVIPTPLAHADASRDVLPRGGTSQGFNVWLEVYFSGSKNVTEFLEDIDNQIKSLEIHSDLSCAYLKGHLLVRALDLYQ
ncbi:uncharacterized protein TNCV_4934271 [Trichonephila clavipes]|nr:uncharacterized protein TNCV_4934271 [Trichonephila clavipes]